MTDEANKNDNKITPDVDTSTQESDDIVLEDNTEVTGADYKAKVDKLRAKIKELERKNAELLDGWQRDKADFINIRKRDDEQKQEFLKFVKSDLISELIPVLDSFESAFKNREAWEKVDKSWRSGVEYISSQLFEILDRNGLRVINPIDEMYNEKRDEAIEMVKVDDKEKDGKILEVIQVGYEMNGKELRAPRVRVAHYEAK